MALDRVCRPIHLDFGMSLRVTSAVTVLRWRKKATAIFGSTMLAVDINSDGYILRTESISESSRTSLSEVREVDQLRLALQARKYLKP